MAKHINKRLQTDNTTGFGTNSYDDKGRFLTPDGRPNTRKVGLSWSEGISWYHTLINMPTLLFLAILLIGFILVNFLFTTIYYFIGIDQFVGMADLSGFALFRELFFFSSQTFTTVGYGRISPIGNASGLLSTFEAFVGLLGFALASGLFLARFSRPSSSIKFSKNVLISPFKDKTGLMFRMAPSKNNVLSDVEVKVLLAIRDIVDGRQVNNFYPLKTAISSINVFSLSWTLVHEIDEDSPLYGFTEQDYKETPFEVLVFTKAFDETHSNKVVERHSYLYSECVYGAKFKLMYHPDANTNKTVLDFGKIHEYDMVEMG